MLSIIKSISLNGLDGYAINVQVDVSAGMPCWELVGLPDASVRESKERVKTAIKNSGFELLSRKIVINLAPADIKKEGSFLDLAIAVGIINSIVKIDNYNFEKTAFIGELSLDGKLNSITGILPMCIEAKKLNIETLIIPEENIKEASIVNGIKILGAKNLNEVIDYLNKNEELKVQKNNWKKLINKNFQYNEDFAEVKGQENAKRGIEIAAAGGHNILLIRKSRSRKNYASQKNTNNPSRPNI